ncbi:MAG TPA: hypothetical protein VGK73_39585, partial [Polyangiaceae bacterium]
EFVSWSLGRQFWYYTGQMPARSWAVGRRLSTWRTEAGWDYNLSFVRNPAFPEAEPRIAVKRLRSGPVIVAGFFAPRTSGATPTPPRSRVTTQGLSPVQTIAAAAGAAIEPDAPIRLSKRGAEIVLATVLANGTLGVATRNSAGTWGAVAPITGRVPTLRRSRALQCWSRTSTDTQLFFVGADHRLYVKRLGTTPAWSDAQIVSPDARLHPFSALAATTRGDKTMELYFIDERALLSIACWTSDSSNPFPGFRTYAIHRTATPTLLPGGAIAATAPRKNHLCVFAVGADLRLHFISWISRSSGGQDWSSLVPLGAAGDLIGPHTRLAAHAPSDSEVEVAALTDAGQLAIYSLRLSGGTWTPAARRVIPDPPALSGTPPAPPAGATTQPARGFRINPFGDLAIFRAQGATGSSVCCAGLRAGESRTLRWDASRPDPWEWFV